MNNADHDALDRADMARLVGGQDTALNALMDRHATAVFHFLCGMLGNEEDASDLAQETFVRVYRARESYAAGQRFSAWLYTIAGNLARNHYRWRARHPNISLHAADEGSERSVGDGLPSAEASPSEAAVREERVEAVRAAVQALPEELREAIILCEWQELAVAEAAAVLGTTPKAVESRLYRARNLLRARLRPWL